MGSTSAQGQSIVLFLIAFVLLAAGFATGAKFVFFILAALAFGLCVWRFQKAKAPAQDSGKVKS